MNHDRDQRRAILHALANGHITVDQAETALNIPTAPRTGPAIAPSPLLSQVDYHDQYGRGAAGTSTSDAWGRRWDW